MIIICFAVPQQPNSPAGLRGNSVTREAFSVLGQHEERCLGKVSWSCSCSCVSSFVRCAWLGKWPNKDIYLQFLPFLCCLSALAIKIWTSTFGPSRPQLFSQLAINLDWSVTNLLSCAGKEKEWEVSQRVGVREMLESKLFHYMPI